MKVNSLNSKMLVNGLMLCVGLAAIVSGIAGKCEPKEGYGGRRNSNFQESRQEYRLEVRSEKDSIKDFHKYSSYTFAGLMGVHLLQHYKPIKNYLKRKRS